MLNSIRKILGLNAGVALTALDIDEHQIRKLAFERAMRAFLNQKFFSMCELRSIEEASGIVMDTKSRDKLQLLHCVAWSEMESGWKELIVAHVAKTFEPYVSIAIEGGAA